MNPFEEKIKQLVAKEIEEIKIEKEEMMAFREVWKDHPERRSIIGEAGHEGKIIYRYLKPQP